MLKQQNIIFQIEIRRRKYMKSNRSHSASNPLPISLKLLKKSIGYENRLKYSAYHQINQKENKQNIGVMQVQKLQEKIRFWQNEAIVKLKRSLQMESELKKALNRIQELELDISLLKTIQEQWENLHKQRQQELNAVRQSYKIQKYALQKQLNQCKIEINRKLHQLKQKEQSQISLNQLNQQISSKLINMSQRYAAISIENQKILQQNISYQDQLMKLKSYLLSLKQQTLHLKRQNKHLSNQLTQAESTFKQQTKIMQKSLKDMSSLLQSLKNSLFGELSNALSHLIALQSNKSVSMSMMAPFRQSYEQMKALLLEYQSKLKLKNSSKITKAS